VIAALESTQFVRFAFPSSNPPFCNRNTLWSSEPSRSIRSLDASGSQKIRRRFSISRGARTRDITAQRRGIMGRLWRKIVILSISPL
jgi:hypothetical protein